MYSSASGPQITRQREIPRLRETERTPYEHDSTLFFTFCIYGIGYQRMTSFSHMRRPTMPLKVTVLLNSYTFVIRIRFLRQIKNKYLDADTREIPGDADRQLIHYLSA